MYALRTHGLCFSFPCPLWANVNAIVPGYVWVVCHVSKSGSQVVSQESGQTGLGPVQRRAERLPRTPKLAQARPGAPSKARRALNACGREGPQTPCRRHSGAHWASVNRRPRRPLLGVASSVGLRCLSPDLPSRRRGWPAWRLQGPRPSRPYAHAATTKFAPAAGAALRFLGCIMA